MADRTVRAIFEARVSGAKKDIQSFGKDIADTGKKVDGLTKDLKTLDGAKVKPKIDVEIDKAKKALTDLTRELADLKAQPTSIETEFKIEQTKAAIKDVRGLIKDLTSQKVEVKIDASIKDAQKRISDVTQELGELRTMEVTPEVSANIKAAQTKLREARSELRDLNSAKAEMKVTVDTSGAKREVDGLTDDISDAGAEGGAEAGGNIASGILDALRTIPIAGAVVGIGVAIAGGILLGIKQGLEVEAERDLFSARTGLDEDTSARFGRAAGEAYANAWGDSVAGNLDTAKFALQAGIIDSDATDAEIENVIAKLQGLNDLFEYDIATSVRGVGNLMKSGLVKDADQAFDLIVAASQKVSSDDLLDTLTEYSTQFKLLGLQGPQAFGLIVQAAKAGARDTDNVADTLKEMGLRIREGTKPATDALKLLGLNSKEMVKDFQEGGPNAAKAMDQVFDALRRLEAKGGNTQAVVANLFGGPGEDLGAALYALNVDTAADSLGGLEGAAGAAERALATMSDNGAAKIESAKRNIETAMNGIKGALAAAFEDDIANAADWVSRNRAPLMEFFVDVIDGTFEMGKTFLEFGATAQDAIADVIVGLADLINSLPGDQRELRNSMYGIAEGLRDGATTIREDFIPALDEAQRKADAWAAPEILKARIHDATMVMAADMDTFSAKVKEAGGTVVINGNTLTADEALAELTKNIDGTDGTVTINGDKVPAENALDTLMAEVKTSKGSVVVSANTSAADKALQRLERDRYVDLKIRVAGITSQGGQVKGTHDGGWTGIAQGLHAGGRVPGSDPGYDNILWPLNAGGRTLQQPLAGGEYVVNSKDAAFWAPVLELMNAGARPASASSGSSGPQRLMGEMSIAGTGLTGYVTAIVHNVVDARTRNNNTRRVGN